MKHFYTVNFININTFDGHKMPSMNFTFERVV